MVTSWLAHNPRATTAPTYGDAQRFAVDPKGIPELCEELKQCPRHVPTPLHSLPDLAARLGLGEIRVKDESQRFGFGAFKALGGVIAVYDALAGAVGAWVTTLLGRRRYLPGANSVDASLVRKAQRAAINTAPQVKF